MQTPTRVDTLPVGHILESPSLPGRWTAGPFLAACTYSSRRLPCLALCSAVSFDACQLFALYQ